MDKIRIKLRKTLKIILFFYEIYVILARRYLYITLSFIPVSYTHLDVYKRQGEYHVTVVGVEHDSSGDIMWPWWENHVTGMGVPQLWCVKCSDLSLIHI